MNSTLTIRVPVKFKRQGIRRLILAPEGAESQNLSISQQPDANLIGNLVRAWRWEKMLESGRYKSIANLAEHEKVTSSYLCRILRLNSLAPDIKRAILDGMHPKTLRIVDLMKPFSEVWEEQRKRFGF